MLRLALIVLASLFGQTVVYSKSQSADTQDLRLVYSVDVLERSKTGRDLVKRALRKWKFKKSAELTRVLQIGKVSKTDSILTRHYDPDTGKETRERKITIYLKSGDSPFEMVLDLAHELAHALDGPSWDPYDPRLSPGRYIWESLEGRGGEVEAVFQECKVALELARIYKIPHERCVRYLSDIELGIEKEKIKKDFYLVGKWHDELKNKLGKEEKLFPFLSNTTPQLYSSTGNSPYPVALFEEYLQITKAACQNMASRLKLDRSPASVRRQTKEFLANRCGQTIDETTVSYSSRTSRHP